MRVSFRADASLQIGTGHVMRCLTLAEALRQRGHACRFVCRDFPGNLGPKISEAGFDLAMLPAPEAGFQPAADEPVHAAWAGVPWHVDAAQTLAANEGSDWLIIDHYAFDARWEAAARQPETKLAVIDDLADRPHIANLLIDQNLGRLAVDYDGLVPPHCNRLIGPAYVLMRPEFARLRSASLARRKEARVDHILVTMGGIDNEDATSLVLDALRLSQLPSRYRITVVMGRNAPWLEKVGRAAASMPYPTDVLVDVTDMAALMASADLAVGGAGGTSWERCCLGLPSLLLVMADNQAAAAHAMSDAQVAILLGDFRVNGWQQRLIEVLGNVCRTNSLGALTSGAIELIDGLGCARCLTELEKGA